MNKDLLFLENILESAILIRGYVKDKDVADIEQSSLVKDAISKRLEEIGENMNKISPTLKRKNAQIKWESFIESRNFLSHVYQMVNVNKLLMIVKKELPLLERQIKELMKEINK